MTKRVLITGASKGIGRAVAIELAQSGYDIVIHYGHDQEGAEATKVAVENQGQNAQVLQFDVKDRAAVKEILEQDMNEFGAYYGVVSNAGIFKDAAFPAMSDEEWDSVIQTNLHGFYNVVKPCIMPMVRTKKPGRIVAITSVSGVMGNRGQANYSASKAAIGGAVKSLAIELAKRNITVNCVAPGLIDTGKVSEEVFNHAKKIIPMERMGSPLEVASLVGYLLSDNASYITRQIISVNGGLF